MSRNKFSFYSPHGRFSKTTDEMRSKINVAVERLHSTLLDKPTSEARDFLTRGQVVGDCAPEDMALSADSSGLSYFLGISENSPAISNAEVIIYPNENELSNYLFNEMTAVFKQDENVCEVELSTSSASPYKIRQPLNFESKSGGESPDSEKFGQILRSVFRDALFRMIYTYFENSIVLPAERKALTSSAESIA